MNWKEAIEIVLGLFCIYHFIFNKKFREKHQKERQDYIDMMDAKRNDSRPD